MERYCLAVRDAHYERTCVMEQDGELVKADVTGEIIHRNDHFFVWRPLIDAVGTSVAIRED